MYSVELARKQLQASPRHLHSFELCYSYCMNYGFHVFYDGRLPAPADPAGETETVPSRAQRTVFLPSRVTNVARTWCQHNDLALKWTAAALCNGRTQTRKAQGLLTGSTSVNAVWLTNLIGARPTPELSDRIATPCSSLREAVLA
jgi:hypothetical protein